MFKKLLTMLAIVGTLMSGTGAYALTVTPTPGGAPIDDYIKNFIADPTTFNPGTGDTVTLSFDLLIASYIYLYIIDSDYNIVDAVDSTSLLQPGNITYTWYGRSENIPTGTLLPAGNYMAKVIASSAEHGTGDIFDIDFKNITLGTGPISNSDIKNFNIDPITEWDPTRDLLEIEFQLTAAVDSMKIEALSGSKTITIFDDIDVDDGKYEETWDGTDDDGDYVSQGNWQIKVTTKRDTGNTAVNSEVHKNVKVEYKKPEITEAFVTKTSFDPSIGETTNLVFNVTASANLTIDVYKKGVRQFKLVDEMEVKKNRWYSVNWNGIDDEGDQVVNSSDWKFRILVENKTDDDVSSETFVGFTVAKDEVSSKKANITNDYTQPIVFDDANYSAMDFSYCLDEDAEVFLAIYKGISTSGTVVAELLDYDDQDAGCHTVTWDGKDKNNKKIKDDNYSYKLISKAGSYKDTETGRFIVGNAGYLYDDEEPVYDDDGDDDGTTTPTPAPADDQYLPQGTAAEYYSDLAYATEGSELSNAIAWVTEKGIFQGYSDRTFRPYQPINRAEVLKVVLRAFGTSLMSASGTNEGFKDVDSYAWYMTYVKTAKFYGMLTGYGDGTARLNNDVNRVELLKFVLQASNAFTGYEFTTGYYNPNYADVDPSSWFYDYANTAFSYGLYDSYNVGGQQYLKPAQMVERAEVAVLLYRMAKAGLLY